MVRAVTGGRVARQMCRGGVAAVSMRARELLGRADSLLAEASCVAPDEAAEMFRLAYVAAARGAAAVLAIGGPGAGAARRPRSRNVWVLLEAQAPEFAAWAGYFAAHSATRAAIEAGITRGVDSERAELLRAQTRRFLDEVEGYLDGLNSFDQAG